MKVLSAETLLDALELCDKRPGTEIGIACSCEGSVKDFERVLLSEMFGIHRMNGWEILRALNISGGGIILSKKGNGFCDRSSIRVFSANNHMSFRGMRFQRVLYEDDIDEQILYHLAACERPYRDDVEDEFAMSESLDMFLRSFKII